MNDDFGITEGWTGDLDFIMKVNGVARPWVQGDTVTLILKTTDGRLIETGGNVSVVPDNPPGTVGVARYAPNPGDLKAMDSPLLARFKVVTAQRTVFFPNAAESRWKVYPP